MKRYQWSVLWICGVVGGSCLVNQVADAAAPSTGKRPSSAAGKTAVPTAGKAGPAEAAEEKGRTKLAQQKYAEALTDFQSALAAHQKGGSPEQVAYDTAYVALLQARTNAFDDAANNAESARAKLQGATSPQGKEGFAVALNALGLVASNKGEVENARQQIEAAVQLQQQLWGANDARLVDALVDIAKVQQSQGLNVNADEAFQRALAIREKSSGAQSPLLMPVLEEYANLLTAMDRKSDAATQRQRARAIKTAASSGTAASKSEGVEHSLWTKYMKQGEEQLMAQQKSEAKASYRLALQEAEKIGPNEPKVAATLFNLARAYEYDSDWKGAEQHLVRARQIYEATDPEGQPMAEVLQQLATCYTVQGRERESYDVSKQALALMEKTTQPDDPKLENFMMTVAASAMRLKNNAEAEDLFTKLIKRAEASGDRQKRGRYMAMLGSVYMQQGKQSQGLALIKQGAELMK